MTKMQFRVGVAAAVGVGVIATGVLYATIPDAEGVIHACYSRSQGTIRIIDDSVTNCKQGETSLAWNVKGAQGLPGEQGLPGPKGDTGDSQVFTVGNVQRGTEESLTVPDLGTVVAACSAGISQSVRLTGATPFDIVTVNDDGSASLLYNSASWSSGSPYSQTVWFKNAVAQWRLQYLTIFSGNILTSDCRVAVEVVRIG